MINKKIYPNTFIVGAPRCGTSAMFTNLVEHKDVCGCKIKEPYFFNRKDQRINNISLDSYTNLFNHYNGEKICIEASPCYLYYKNTPNFIKETLGDRLKFIMILRDPAERAFSHYLLNKSLFKNLEDTDFNESLRIENQRIKKNDIYLFHYKAVGMYYKQVKRYFDIFGKENCLVILFQNFQNDKVKTYQNIFSFLNIEEDFIPSHINSSINISSSRSIDNIYSKLIYSNFDLKNKLKSILPNLIKNKLKKFLIKKSTSIETIHHEFNQGLKDFFKDDIDKLSSLIDKDLTVWN